MKRQFVVQK